MYINWDKIESAGKTTLGNDKKIYVDHLPKESNRVKWTKSVGKYIYVLYDNVEYTIKIKEYLGNRKFIIDLVGNNYNEIGHKYKTVVDFWKNNFPELTRKEVNDYLIRGSKLGICTYK